MPAPQGAEIENGPFGIHDVSPDGWDWYYYYRTGAAPNDKQAEFALQCSRLASKIREMDKTDATIPLMAELKKIFSAILVQKYRGDIKPHADNVAELEHKLFRTVVNPAHQERLIRPVIFTVFSITTAVFIILVFSITPVKQWLDVVFDTASIRTFLLVILGTLLGRLIYYGLSHSENVSSMEKYFELIHETRSPKVTIFFDIVVGIVACLLFITGFIVIAVGGNENPATGDIDAAITTLMIRENELLAIAFGVLVGVVKTEFLRKVRDVAKGGFA